MTRQTDNTDIMSQVFAAELGTKTNFLSFDNELLFEVDVSEGTASLVASSRQVIVELDRCKLYGEQVLLCRSTANHKGNVIRRASRCA